MYSLFSNEKLGMSVEQARLGEIRQQIDAQRLADEVKPTGSKRLMRLPVRWFDQAKAWLMVTVRTLRIRRTPTYFSRTGQTPFQRRGS
jgi:hypothetical protein